MRGDFSSSQMFEKWISLNFLSFSVHLSTSGQKMPITWQHFTSQSFSKLHHVIDLILHQIVYFHFLILKMADCSLSFPEESGFLLYRLGLYKASYNKVKVLYVYTCSLFYTV